jgi:hypothetical protein
VIARFGSNVDPQAETIISQIEKQLELK